jgi:lipopolysaccharide export system protein LptC
VLFSGGDSPLIERREVNLAAARRHTRFMRFLKSCLLLGMAGIAATVGYFIVMSAIQPPPVIDPDIARGEDRAVINPRYTGYDANGTPFEITASSAEREQPGSNVMQLAAPRLDMTGERNPSSMVEAVVGRYDQDAHLLELRDGVAFRTSDGYAFESENAVVYVDEGRVVGDRPIRGEGPIGSIRADEFEIQNNGEAVVFIGQVEAVLYPDRTEGVFVVSDGEDGAAVEASDEAAAQSDETIAGETVGDFEPVQADVVENQSTGEIATDGGPIYITADRSEFLVDENLNRWSGAVIVSQGDARLMADEMDFHFDDPDESGARTINRIDARGGVSYSTPNETARGDEGVYLAETDTINITGRVDLVQGASRLSGEFFEANLATGEYRMRESRSRASGQSDRVRGVLRVEDLDSGGGGSETSNPDGDQPQTPPDAP